MQNGGAALMGTGIGRGENRALEAAQQAISSPLLDNVSIAGATGVLINIIGGDDLTLGETTQINDIIHDAVGDEAEIIFGAGNDPAMQGEVRVTVIATGFDRAMPMEPPMQVSRPSGAAGVLSFPTTRGRPSVPVQPPVADAGAAAPAPRAAAAARRAGPRPRRRRWRSPRSSAGRWTDAEGPAGRRALRHRLGRRRAGSPAAVARSRACRWPRRSK